MRSPAADTFAFSNWLAAHVVTACHLDAASQVKIARACS